MAMPSLDPKNIFSKENLLTTVLGAVAAAGYLLYNSLLATPPEPIDMKQIGIAFVVALIGGLLGIKKPDTATFSPGDTVTLNSGGPVMTVVSQDAKTGDVKCQWVDSAGEKKENTFNSSTIKKV